MSEEFRRPPVYEYGSVEHTAWKIRFINVIALYNWIDKAVDSLVYLKFFILTKVKAEKTAIIAKKAQTKAVRRFRSLAKDADASRSFSGKPDWKQSARTSSIASESNAVDVVRVTTSSEELQNKKRTITTHE